MKVASASHALTVSGGRRVMRARLVFWKSGASGMGANAVDKTSTFYGVFKIKARPCLPPLSASTVATSVGDGVHDVHRGGENGVVVAKRLQHLRGNLVSCKAFASWLASACWEASAGG